MTIYKVLCCNYTGAHFRGFEDPTDSQICLLSITGSENKIVAYLLDNMHYGSGDANLSMDWYIKMLKKHQVPQFDGCGGVFQIWKDDVPLFDGMDEYGYDEEGEKVEKFDPQHEFAIDVDQLRVTDRGYDWHLNHLIEQKLKTQGGQHNE